MILDRIRMALRRPSRCRECGRDLREVEPVRYGGVPFCSDTCREAWREELAY